MALFLIKQFSMEVFMIKGVIKHRHHVVISKSTTSNTEDHET